jgi:hypothetical protein
MKRGMGIGNWELGRVGRQGSRYCSFISGDLSIRPDPAPLSAAAAAIRTTFVYEIESVVGVSSRMRAIHSFIHSFIIHDTA